MSECSAKNRGEPRRSKNWVPPSGTAALKGMASVDFDAIDIAVNKPWVIKGVIAMGETSSWIGGPGAGKSALLTDLSIHVAGGLDWRGYRSKGQFGVIYVAFERGALVRRRLQAYKRKFSLEGLPLAIVSSPTLDLMDPSSIDLLKATIHEHSARWNVRVGLVIIDTFGKALAKGGGDENSAKDQNRSLGHLRLVQEDTNVHFALIGHTGKDESRGARGSNAHAGDVDLMVQVTGKVTKTTKITKGNDQVEGILTTYVMESFDLGVDEDGDRISVGIVTSGVPGERPKRASGVNLGAAEKVALRILREAIDEAEVKSVLQDAEPRNVKAVSLTQWRRDCIAGGISAADTYDAQQKAFSRAFKSLRSKNIIEVWDPYVWLNDDVSV